jgi:hypothetical protein
MKVYGGVDAQIHIFLTFPLVAGECSVSHPSRIIPGTQWIRGWVGPRTGMQDTEKRNACLCRDSNPDHGRLTRKQSLHRLCYPDSLYTGYVILNEERGFSM